jgi:predicted nucleic acid-binding protein
MNDELVAPRIYLDSNVFIRAFESVDEESKLLRTLFEALRARRHSAVTSELTLAEVLGNGRDLHFKRRFYRGLIEWSGFIDLRPVSRSILIETADLRKAAKHNLPDAIHLVTAIRAGCSLFASHDRRMRPPKGMRLVLPDATGVTAILSALHA